jgi:hypothetical protein
MRPLLKLIDTRSVAFDHVTSWLNDLRANADENVAIICESSNCTRMLSVS